MDCFILGHGADATAAVLLSCLRRAENRSRKERCGIANLIDPGGFHVNVCQDEVIRSSGMTLVNSRGIRCGPPGEESDTHDRPSHKCARRSRMAQRQQQCYSQLFWFLMSFSNSVDFSLRPRFLLGRHAWQRTTQSAAGTTFRVYAVIQNSQNKLQKCEEVPRAECSRREHLGGVALAGGGCLKAIALKQIKPKKLYDFRRTAISFYF